MDPAAHGPDPLTPTRTPRRVTGVQLVAVDLVILILAALVGLYLPPLTPVKYDGAAVHILVDGLWLVASGVFLLRRRHPRAVLVLLLVLFVVGMCVRSPAPASNYLGFVVYSVVVTSNRRAGVWAAVGALVVTVAGLMVGGGPLESGAIVSAVANVFLGWLAGEYVRTARGNAALRARLAAAEAAAAEAGRADQLGQAVADERAKLARELHDVVAHGMSVVAVRAGVARIVMDSQPDQAREALAIIETTTRRTLQEMRLLVGVLRGDREQEADRAPVPGLRDLPGLIAHAELAGLSIDLAVHGQARRLAPAVDLSAYRIVQEALTNASLHAGPTFAHVSLDYHPSSIAIRVHDDGPRPEFTPHRDPRRRGAGHGLIGIRERAALFGGVCTAGPVDAGYQVDVTLRTTDGHDAAVSARSGAALASSQAVPTHGPGGPTP